MLFTYLSICVTVYLWSISGWTCMYIFLSLYLACLSSVSLSAYIPGLSLALSLFQVSNDYVIYLSICLSAYLTARFSIYISLYLYLSMKIILQFVNWSVRYIHFMCSLELYEIKWDDFVCSWNFKNYRTLERCYLSSLLILIYT